MYSMGTIAPNITFAGKITINSMPWIILFYHLFALLKKMTYIWRNKHLNIPDIMSNIISEVTPISEKDCFYLAERHKTEFSYPLHKHKEYELNFVCNCRGAQRVVGDSIEEVGDLDLALLGSGIEHEWQQGMCQ